MAHDRTLRLVHAERNPGPNIAPGAALRVGVNTLHPPYGAAAHANAIQEMQTIGATILRTGLTWSSMQPTNGGAIDWTEPDSIVAKCLAAGITPMMAIETTPQWANPSITGTYSVFAIPIYPSAAFTTWAALQAAWFAQVVARYGTSIKYELWNEWGSAGSGFWRPNNDIFGIPSTAAYMDYYNPSRTAGKGVNPNITVACGSLTALTFWSGSNAVIGTTAITELMNTHHIVTDAFNIHPYTTGSPTKNPAIDNFPNGNSFDDIGRIQALMVANGYGNTPLWITEWGNYDGATLGETVKASYVDYSLNAILDTYSATALGAGQAGVEVACYYQLRNLSNGTTDIDSSGLYTGTPANGPNIRQAAGQTYLVFTQPAPVLDRIVLMADTSVINTNTTGVPVTQCFDQYGAPFPFSPGFASATPAKATIDAATGVATGVATGTSNITATAVNTLGATITSNIVVLTVVAQVATSIVPSPLSFTAQVGAGTVTVSGTVYDQDATPNVISGATIVWSSLDAAKATVNSSTGVVTPVGAGTVTIRATYGSAIADIPGTIQASASVVTTVTQSPTSFTIGVGLTQQQAAVVKDQNGNVMPSETVDWFTSDALKATVNSSGVVTGVAAGSVTITAKSHTDATKQGTAAGTVSVPASYDSTTYNAVTGVGIGGSTGTPIVWDAAGRYANDAAFRQVIAFYGTGNGVTLAPLSNNALKGTAPDNSLALYRDGRYPDLVLWQNSVQFNSTPSYACTVRGLNQSSESPTPYMANLLPGNTYRSVWLWHRRFNPAGTTAAGNATGAAATWNATQGAAWKNGAWAAYAQGRAGGTITNASGTGGDIAVTNAPQGVSAVGITEQNTGGVLTNEFTVGDWFDYAWRVDQWTGANGHVYYGAATWERRKGAATYTRTGRKFTKDSGGAGGTYINYFAEVQMFGLNHNLSRSTDMLFYIWGHATWNMDTDSDPLGIAAMEAGLTPENPLTNTKTSQTSVSATFSVTVGRFTGYLRPVIDGTPQPSLDLPISRDVTDNTVVAGFVVPLSVGTHTVAFRAMSSNKLAQSAATSNTITGIAIT